MQPYTALISNRNRRNTAPGEMGKGHGEHDVEEEIGG